MSTSSSRATKGKPGKTNPVEPNLNIASVPELIEELNKRKKPDGKVVQFVDKDATGGRVAVHSDLAPAAVGPYSQAIRDGRGTVYLSGQVGLIPGTKTLVEGGVREQTRQALENLANVLAAANSSVGLICKTTVLLHDIADYGAMNEEYASFFAEHKVVINPARAAFAVKDLPLGAKVEIEAIAIEKQWW